MREPRLRLGRSFVYACQGLRTLFESQGNMWVHLACAVGVIALGGWFRLTVAEWCWIVLAIGLVVVAESLNTAVEFVADVTSPEFHPLIKKAKDVAAGGVLTAAVVSVAIAGLVFGPRFAEWWRG